MELRILVRQLAPFPRTPNENVDLRHPVRLGQVIVRAEPDGRDRRLDRAVARDDDDLGVVRFLVNVPEHLEAVHLGHDDVQERDVVRLAPESRQRGRPVARHRDLIPASEQELFEDRPKVFLVFGDQDLDPWSGRGRGHEVASSAGSRILNVLPAPGALSTSMRPPWSAMIP